ncbi:MAG: ATP-binding protein [Deltaproteobacteria bacterium]|nr:ATP-binding protein [Deltaproteobacteria bacterium]
MDQPRVTGMVTALGYRAEAPVDPTFIADGEPAVCVIDPDVLGPDAPGALRELFARTGSAPAVFLCGSCDRDRLSHLVGVRNLAAIVARSHVASDEDLRHALSAVTHGPTFGWGEALRPGAAEQAWRVAGSADRDRCLDAVAAFASERGVRRRIVRLVQDVADELITNAVYDAPSDATGQRLYAALDRRQPVELDDASRPTLRMACEDGHVRVAVEDPFGSLALETVRYYLAKGLRAGNDQVDDKQGGAGLGLTRIYESVDRMTVKVEPGRRTEITATIELGGARGDMATRPAGLVLARTRT